MAKTYKIILANNQGSFAVDALAHGVGVWRDCVSNYNGEGHDLAFVDLYDDADADEFEALLEASENVIRYAEVE